jgi:DNA-binding TFAR19-related protein (PDSD5 family)
MTATELLPGGSSLSSEGLNRMSMGMQRQTHREVERVQSRAIVAKLTEDGRAFLTNTALEHVGALTALEQHLISIAPLGEARYREIVDSYTLGASAAIRRWH